MQPILIRNARLVEPGKGINSGDLLVRDGRIAALGTIAAQDAAGANAIDAGRRLLTPGLIDIHTHVYHKATSLSVDPGFIARR